MNDREVTQNIRVGYKNGPRHDDPQSGGESLSIAFLLKIEDICHRFETAWKEGQPQKVEDLLESLPEEGRGRLEQELRDLELALRAEKGEQALRETVSLRTFAGYEILGEMGRGGMGIVYKARQPGLNRLVALKMILSGELAGPEELDRFRTEAEAVAHVQHPNIVQVFEVGEKNGLPFLSLELVGDSLAKTIGSTPQPPKEAARIVQALAQAMHHAHERGIIHRDLKPANVLLTKDGIPKITDFGLAKRFENQDRGQTRTGAIFGTPSYMAPEQTEGNTRQVSPAADIYALGAILYEMLTGRPPFHAPDAIQTLAMVRTMEPVAPRQLQSKVPIDLETICLKCLQKESAKRYTTALALAEDLGRFLTDEPIKARPVGRIERMVRWSRRNPALAITGSLAVFCLLIVVIIASYFAVQESRHVSLMKVSHSAELVKRLLDAETDVVQSIVADIAEYRQWADPLLRQENEKATAQSRQKLHVSLALLPVDSTQVDYLYGRLLDAEPQQVPVIRDALTPHKEQLLDKLWTVVEKPDNGKEPQRLRAAAALAKFDPKSEKWAKANALVVNDLVLEDIAFLRQWSDNLSPVKVILLEPLTAISQNQRAERTMAMNMLAALFKGQFLADLLMDADEKQFAVLWSRFKVHEERSLTGLAEELDKQVVELADKLVFEFKGTIAEGDAKVETRNGSRPTKRFVVPLVGGKTYRVTLESAELDSILELQDGTGKTLEFGKGVGLGFNPLMLLFTPRNDDTYTVIAASLTKTGSFHVSIVEVIADEDAKEKLAKRQANAAVALVRMGLPEKAWQLLKHSPDPRARSYLIHRLGRLGASISAIVKRLDEEPDITIRRALILSLGEFGEKEWTAGERNVVTTKLQDVYRTAPDPGIHASAEWVLREWKHDAWLRTVNEKWGKEQEQSEKKITQSLAKEKQNTPPQWYVNGQGQTMVVIPGPVEFMMGSPPLEKGRAWHALTKHDPDSDKWVKTSRETWHKKRIGGSFALAAKSVTVDQYQRFDKSFFERAFWREGRARKAPAPDCPVISVSWHQAAAYCNWLSKAEGIPADQWCYEIKGEVAELKEKFLSLTGYRLPTEAEMEYSTRAGAMTSRYYGETDELLPKYAWYETNSQDRTWPVGSKKPNDLGFFDMHGNVCSLCGEKYKTRTQGGATEFVLLCGGSYNHPASFVRSASRDERTASSHYLTDGFRVAKTVIND